MPEHLNFDRSKNVLFLLHRPPPVHGSAVVGEQIASSAAIREAFTCRFINLLASKNTNETGQLNLSKLLGTLGIIGSLLKLLISKKPDLCYFALTVSGFAFYRDVLLVFILKLRGVPIVFHMHHRGVAKRNQGLAGVLLAYVFKGSKVILLSERLCSDVTPVVERDQILICPNGLGEPLPASEVTVKEKQLETTPTVLFLSNLIKEKGIDLLIEACERLTKAGLAYRCVIIGGDADRSKSDIELELREKGLSQHIDCAGKRYGQDKEKYLAEADLFVFPTYYYNETFGLVLLEAMRHGLPCISTDTGGIPDIVLDQKTGYIVPQKDPDALADRMLELLENSELRSRMGQAGEQHYRKHFTNKEFERRMIEVINICLA